MFRKVLGMIVGFLLPCLVLGETIDLDSLKGSEWWSEVVIQIEQDQGQTHQYDPRLPQSPNWTADPTDQVSAEFGFSVSSAGDVNNDGYGDVIIGAWGWNGEADYEGRAYVYHGGPGGLSTTPNWTADPTDQTWARFGASVSSAGDVNNDGYGDVVIGAFGWNGDTLTMGEGRAYVYHGGPGGLSTTPNWTADPTDQEHAQFGHSVSSAGDVNGDGYGDVVIGAYGWDGDTLTMDEGRAYVYHGGPGGLSTTPNWTADPTDQFQAGFGRSVSSAGDVDNDGYGDVIIGAYGWDGGATDEGRAYLYHGGPGGLSTTPNWTADPTDQFQAGFGLPVSSAGDVNNDGYGDVIIGAYGWDGGATDEGRAYVYHGGPGGLSTTPNWTADPTDQETANFGQYVSSAGDVNNDGYDDVIIGAAGWDGNTTMDEGRAYVYQGGAGGLSTTPNWTADPTDQWFTCFGRVSSAGDVNNDGYGDVIIGAAQWSGDALYEGRAYVYHGEPFHDVGTASVDEPPDTVACKDTVLVAAAVCNYGDTVETFDVKAIIDSSGVGVYADTQTVVGLQPDSCSSVSFANWLVPPVHGVSYTVTVITLLAGDNSNQNDTLSKGSLAWCPPHDVGTASVDEPPDTVACGDTVSVAATVCNYADTVETFDVKAIIDSSGNVVYADTQTAVGLTTGDCDTVSFADWVVPSVHGVSYTVTVTTMLGTDINPTNDTATKETVAWCPAHDVGADSVVQPPDTVACDDTVSVVALVCNYGTLVEMFDVGAFIDSSGIPVYADTQTVLNLAPGACDTVGFADWIVPPVHGVSYTVMVTTLLQDDINAANDTATKETLAWCPAHDAATVSIVSPPDTVPCGLDTIPRARVCNYGNLSESFDVACYFDSSGNIVYGDTVGVDSLLPGDTATVDFSAWTACATHDVTYLMTVTTLLGDDSDPANDSLQKTVTTWCPGIEEIVTIQVIPSIYGLKQSRPNPTRGWTRIDYQLPAKSTVCLRVYDLAGTVVRTLVEGVEEAGFRTVVWDGRDDGGDQVASGIYFYRLNAGSFAATRKMVVLR